VNRRLYGDLDPIEAPGFTDKTGLLAEIDAYCRAKGPRVVQVSASLAGSRRAVTILRPDGARVEDARPLVRINVSVTVERDGRRENGSAGAGGREAYAAFIAPERWKALADEALRIALVNLDALPAPSGEMDVVLGPGWPGVLLHEAVGHGLEGDFNRKGASAFAGKIGQRVAAPGVTVVDDGTFENRRGSLTIDDEGTPTGRTVLIEDGILKGYLQDRMNARLMGVAPTGNGRRESYAHRPMPRMTNTFMEAGEEDPGEILAALKNGVYAVGFGGGQVDITSGKFVFQCTEAYLVEDGQIKHPIKGATLIGDGPSVLTRVKMVGNDLKLDEGVGTCGKDGQSVPVGVGQPTLYVSGLTVGGAG
jgi:TldD protein